jgi:hypothetical protein
MRVAVELPQRRRIDEIDVPPHQFGEGVLGMGLGIAVEQFVVGCHAQSIYSTRRSENRTRKIGFDTGVKVRHHTHELTVKFPLPY